MPVPLSFALILLPYILVVGLDALLLVQAVEHVGQIAVARAEMDAADAVEQVVAVDGQLIAQVAEYLVGSAHRLEVEAVGVVALHDILALALEAALLQRHP